MDNRLRYKLATTLTLAMGSAVCAHAADWLQFGYDAAHSGFNRAETGYSTATGNRTLRHYVLPAAAGVADSAPVYLGDVATNSGTKNLLFLAMKNGTLLALDADSPTLNVIWSQQAAAPLGDSQVATGSPVIDPSLQVVYAYAHDGRIHKYQVGDGTEIMRVLDVEHRVVVRLRQRQVDVEHHLRVGLARDQEIARRVAADRIDQIAQRDVTAGALGNLDLFAATHG